jgi:hypothetical protein
MLMMIIICTNTHTHTHTHTHTGWSKSLCIWCLQYRKLAKKDGHHRIHSECGPCYTEHGLREQFGVSINVWRLAGDNLNITCNFLYCNHQVHREFLITLYIIIWNYITNYYRLLNCICSHCHISSTAHILSYSDLLFYVILTILTLYNFSERNIKAPWRWCRSTVTCRSICNII